MLSHPTSHTGETAECKQVAHLYLWNKKRAERAVFPLLACGTLKGSGFFGGMPIPWKLVSKPEPEPIPRSSPSAAPKEEGSKRKAVLKGAC